MENQLMLSFASNLLFIITIGFILLRNRTITNNLRLKYDTLMEDYRTWSREYETERCRLRDKVCDLEDKVDDLTTEYSLARTVDGKIDSILPNPYNHVYHSLEDITALRDYKRAKYVLSPAYRSHTQIDIVSRNNSDWSIHD